MSDLFSIYEDSLNLVLRNITSVIETMHNLSKEKTESALNETNNNIKEAERILKQMDLEVSAEKNINSDLLAVKLRNYKSEVDIIKKRFLRIQANYIASKSRDAMLLEGMDSFEGLEDNRKEQRRKLIENEQSAWEISENIEKMKRKAAETENASFDIMLNLDRQSKQMRDINNHVFKMNQDVDKSSNLITRMLARENRGKLYLGVFSFILIIAFFFFLYWKFN